MPRKVSGLGQPAPDKRIDRPTVPLPTVMAILERETRDPGGKLVDVYPHTPFVSAICCRFTEEPGDDDLRALVLSVFEEIAASANRRVRERDLPISLGRFSNRHGDRFVALCLPEVLMVDIHFMFQDAIRTLGRIEEISRAAWRDVQARHFGRYANGRFIFYARPGQQLDTQSDSLLRESGCKKLQQ